MAKNEPRRLIIEFDDRSTKEVEFGKLSGPVQIELSKLRDFQVSSPLLIPQKYLLLKWEDGWQEVMGIEEGCFDLFKYYVLQRVEEFGRLAIERTGPFPAVRIIGRKPDELEEVALTDGTDTKTYALAKGGGLHVEGGKTEIQYKLERVGVDPMEKIVDQLKKALGNDGTKAKVLLAKSHAEKLEAYERIRREIGLKASEKQEDVLAFIQMMLQILAIKEET